MRLSYELPSPTLEKLVDLRLDNKSTHLSDLAIYMQYQYDETHPSVRLRRLNIRRPLRDIGINADIIYRYEDLLPYKNILISHLEPALVPKLIELRKLGKKLFFCHSEALWGLVSQEEIFNLCDYIVCCSNKLAEFTQPKLTSKFTKCVVIPDMAEPSSAKHSPKESKQLRVCFSGMGGNGYLIRRLQPIIEKLGMKLVMITEHPDADIKWHRDTYLSDMAACDIAVCPQNAIQPAKSAVKLVTAMSIGMPTVCSPNPAYLEIADKGINCFVADSPVEWEIALLTLRDNIELRRSMSLAAQETAKAFTPHAIALHWLDLLSQDRTKVALINNTLPIKYMSYGDDVQDKLRLNGYEVENFRYQDIDALPQGFDYYLFIEVRYDSRLISDIKPRILYTKERPDINHLTQFDLVLAEDQAYAQQCRDRGFVHVFHIASFQMDQITTLVSRNLIEDRKKHNQKIHTQNINSFYSLQKPEERWVGGTRDQYHIKYVNDNTLVEDSVLDVGSADGWLSLYLAKNGRNVSGLEFVDRGISWTMENAKRLQVSVDVRKGFIEDVTEIFSDKKFDAILCFEVLEHLDCRKINYYLKKLTSLLANGGKLLISLPMQDMNENIEHLWSPDELLIKQLFPKAKIEWVTFVNANVKGNWFIRYDI